MSTADDPKECFALRGDYLECLHHRKEIGRINEVVRERNKQMEEEMEKAKEALFDRVRKGEWVNEALNKNKK